MLCFLCPTRVLLSVLPASSLFVIESLSPSVLNPFTSFVVEGKEAKTSTKTRENCRDIDRECERKRNPQTRKEKLEGFFSLIRFFWSSSSSSSFFFFDVCYPFLLLYFLPPLQPPVISLQFLFRLWYLQSIKVCDAPLRIETLVFSFCILPFLHLILLSSFFTRSSCPVISQACLSHPFTPSFLYPLFS